MSIIVDIVDRVKFFRGNQAQESSGRSLAQALSRTAVPVRLPIRLRSFLAERTAESISLIADDIGSYVPCFTTFKSSSVVFPKLDRPTVSIVLNISSANLPAVCAIISFTETCLTFVVIVVVKQILPRKARPRYFYLPLRPPGGGDPAFRRPGARYFSQNYFTLTLPVTIVWVCCTAFR